MPILHLTLLRPGSKSNPKVFPSAVSFYAQWRVRCGAAAVLRDDRDSPPERLLQAVWQQQRLRRDQLTTRDGRPVRVLHPGFANAEGGPDFRDAVLQIGGEPPRTGDVEVDLRPAGWHAHGHDRNPAFRNVILHVVWDSESAAPGGSTENEPPPPGRPPAPSRTVPPTMLTLCQSLDAPVGELSLWLECEPERLLPAKLRGRCSTVLRESPEKDLAELLREAGRVRFQSKTARFIARARHAGWEQALWEGLFRALGYKHNVWPMHGLAETRLRWMNGAGSTFALQARLLGLSGLLPAELSRAQTGGDGYLRRAWDIWWRERDAFEECLLPRSLWRFHGLRPANLPQRRLALAAHWLTAGDLAARLERWCAAELPDGALADSLQRVLAVPLDDFWSWHWTLRSPRLPRPRPLLGATRITDLAVNVILPWLWSRAEQGGHRALRGTLEHRYFAWPAGQDNALLRLARHRFLNRAPRPALRGAVAQQGLMQIIRDFCEHSNAICDGCHFPELMREWRPRGGKRPA